MPKCDPIAPSEVPDPAEPRGQIRKAQSARAAPELAEAIDQTVRLWRKHHLDYDQTKYVVERARRRLELSPPRERKRTVERLDWPEVQRLVGAAYSLRST